MISKETKPISKVSHKPRNQRYIQNPVKYVQLLCVCLCVCVCVCVCVFILSTFWFLPAARLLWHTWDVWINDLLLWVPLGAFAKFLHLYFQIYHTQCFTQDIPCGWVKIYPEAVIFVSDNFLNNYLLLRQPLFIFWHAPIFHITGMLSSRSSSFIFDYWAFRLL